MMRIQPLDASTADGIAAGEVIERPASVVKELIDNALDAGSTRIDIALENGGRRLIQVSDNGCGMYADDVPRALQRYSTSKIRRLEDLQQLTTLGYRGEALASVVAVAGIEIYTRPGDCASGVVGVAGAGQPTSVQAMGCPVGTRVCVHHLFRHVPVRLRALRAVSREVRHIHHLVAHYALAHPSVTFDLRHDGRRLLFSQACDLVMQRAAHVLSGELVAALCPVHFNSIDIQVEGFVSNPTLSRASRQRQYVWINGRPVRCMLINHAVERIYAGRLPPGRHPVFALGLSVSPAMIDVNVHPRKSEVKLLHERAVFTAVQEAVAGCVNEAPDDLPIVAQGSSPGAWDAFAGCVAEVSEATSGYQTLPGSGHRTALQPMGQLGNTYVAAKHADGLVLLDQHAAHEALLFDALLRSSHRAVALDEPVRVHMQRAHLQRLDRLLPVLQTLPFDVNRLGRGIIAVHGVPEVLQPLIQAGTIQEAIEEACHRMRTSTTPDDMRDQLCAAFSCRAAVRAGDRLDDEQLQYLVDAVAMQRMAYACPHGRPTYLTLTMAELERRFLRFFPLDTRTTDC